MVIGQGFVQGGVQSAHGVIPAQAGSAVTFVSC